MGSEDRVAVATPHAAATDAGVDAFRHGGNAIDAALSAAFALTVAYPHNTSIGGDLIALIRDPDGTISCVNSSGPAARNVDVAALRAEYGETMPLSGVHTVTVPGAVAGLGALHEMGATRGWADHLDAAYELADSGVPVAPGVAAAIEEERALILADPGLASVLAPDGRLLQAGDRLSQPALARSLRTLAADGPAAMYGGTLGAHVLAGLAERGGHLEAADLVDFRPRVEKPLHAVVQGHDVWTSGPNSQGFVLLQILGAIESLGHDCEPLGRDAGMMSNLFRAGTADRVTHLADPATMTTTVTELLAPERLNALAQWAAGDGGRDAASSESPSRRPKGDTIAVVTADSDGRAVSLIQSLYYGFGAGILDPTTGIVLHNRGNLFSLAADSPNCIAPGRRPAHTLMPVMVTVGSTLRWVVGTMGGKAQAQIIAQVLLRLFGGATPVEALAAPRWVVEVPDGGPAAEVAFVESPVESEAQQSIAARLPVTPLGVHDETTGHTQVIAIEADGALLSGSDPRSDGRADSVSRAS
jgi:gamma-glutamyltranspeptidase/glutathione hydrolase